jgi:hypothetical protein
MRCRLRNTIIALTALSLGCAGRGCISLGDSYLQQGNDGSIADMHPTLVCGAQGVIRPGLSRQDVEAIMTRYKLTPGQHDQYQTTYGVRGEHSEFWLLSPEGTGTFRRPTVYNLTIKYDDTDHVVRCYTTKVRN